MSLLEDVQHAFESWPAPRLEGHTLVVPTQCLYPDNGIVDVYVDGGSGGAEYVVHDNGGAFGQLAAAGWYDGAVGGTMKRAVRRQGLEVNEKHAIFAKGVVATSLAATIVLVANGAQDAAHYLLSSYRPASRRPISEQIEIALDLRFPHLWRKEERFVGASTKPHRFDYVVNLSSGAKLLMDIVRPEASSINSVVVGHLDVAHARPKDLHRAVYDDQERWSSENLSLIRVGATPVPVSTFDRALESLAA